MREFGAALPGLGRAGAAQLDRCSVLIVRDGAVINSLYRLPDVGDRTATDGLLADEREEAPDLLRALKGSE